MAAWWQALVREWRELTPRQRHVGNAVGVLWVLSDALDFVAPSPPLSWPWWMLLDAFVLCWTYFFLRSRSYARWRDSLRPQDLPRFDQLMPLLLPLLVMSRLAWLALGDSVLTRVFGLPSLVVLWAVVVLSAGARRPERRERQWSLPWPFNVSSRVPPADS